MPEDTVSGPASTRKNSGRLHRRFARSKSQGRHEKTYAALDLGTNNCRLLIAKPQETGFRVIDSYSKVVRLGQGMSRTGLLSDESMHAAVEAIKLSAKKMRSRHVKRWRCVATQACRQAENGDAFLKRVKEETGLTLEVISPRVESRLAVMGCINLIDTQCDVVLVVDIGGGSTELSWVDVRQLRDINTPLRVHRPPISAWASIPLGVVSLSEIEPERDDRETWYEDMKNRVREALALAKCTTRFANVFTEGRGHIIGTSGTITSLAGIHLGLDYYRRDKVDGMWMPSQSAVRIARRLASQSVEERATEPCIGQDRAHLLVAGCAITDVICELWQCDNIRVGDRGLREGILMGLMEQAQAPVMSSEISNKGRAS